MKILLFDSGLGLIPSFNYLLKNKYNHDYYIEMEENFFPFGNKSEEDLVDFTILKLKKWEQENYDLIYIVCNTISVILKTKIAKISSKIRLILNINEILVDKYNSSVLGTKITCNYFKNKNKEVVDGSHLVRLIEERKIEKLILEIKKLEFKNHYVVLGCTHFSHILFLLKIYHPNITFIDGYHLLFLDLIKGSKLSCTFNNKAKNKTNLFFFSHNNLI